MLETVTGATLTCAGGGATLMFDALPDINVTVQEMPAGTILNMVPFLNLIPMGICALLTAEAGGVPIPCLPTPVGPWMAGDPSVLINGQPALDSSSCLFCVHGGIISVTFPNNETTLLEG